MRSFMAEVFSAEDLKRGIFSTRGCGAQPPYFAVLGHPVAHSKSPLMQNAALEEIAKSDSRYRGSKYFAFDVPPDELPDYLNEFWRKNFTGINLTIPHKEIAMSIVGEFDPYAAKVGACNTLLKNPRGWKGYNTDGFGLETAIKKAFGREMKGSNVVVIGAGGAARAAAFHALFAGCKSLSLVNRSPQRLDKLSSDIRAAGFDCPARLASENLDIPDSPIIINATSLGLKEGDPPCADFSAYPKDSVFFDMPYAKGRETSSVAAAKKCGIAACGGLTMLAWQGAKSLSIWTGKPLLGDIMLETLAAQK